MEKSPDELYEALVLEKVFQEAQTPPFTGYGPNPEWWPSWGGPWPARRPGKVYPKPDIHYHNTDGILHRLYGPAYISQHFDIEAWFKNGERHREGGPAYTHKNNMVWFFEGKVHRLDGPAVIEGGGPKQYWIHGVKYSKKQYDWEIARMKRKGLIK